MTRQYECLAVTLERSEDATRLLFYAAWCWLDSQNIVARRSQVNPRLAIDLCWPVALGDLRTRIIQVNPELRIAQIMTFAARQEDFPPAYEVSMDAINDMRLLHSAA